MDELKFRRQAYEDPHNQDPEFLEQMRAKPEHQALGVLVHADAEIQALLAAALG